MEKINPNAAALAGGITVDAISIVCLVFVAIAPIGTVASVANSLFHGLDVSSIAVKSISLGSSLMGLIVLFLLGAVSGYVFAFAYNKLSEKVQ